MNVNKITENKNTSSNNMKEVGKRIERIDGEKKLDGTEIFGDDFSPENSLLIKVLRSPLTEHHLQLVIIKTGSKKTMESR